MLLSCCSSKDRNTTESGKITISRILLWILLPLSLLPGSFALLSHWLVLLPVSFLLALFFQGMSQNVKFFLLTTKRRSVKGQRVDWLYIRRARFCVGIFEAIGIEQTNYHLQFPLRVPFSFSRRSTLTAAAHCPQSALGLGISRYRYPLVPLHSLHPIPKWLFQTPLIMNDWWVSEEWAWGGKYSEFLQQSTKVGFSGEWARTMFSIEMTCGFFWEANKELRSIRIGL